MTAPLANVNPNGTWKLRIIDYEAGNTGRVYSANLQLATPDLASSPQCTTARTTLSTAATTVDRAKLKVIAAQSKLNHARRTGHRKAARALEQKVNRKKLARTRAKSNLAAAQAQKVAACGP